MSIYGKKVVAILDTQSTFGQTFQSVVDNVATLSNQMSTLLADSPESLNTLNEIAAAVGDDPAFFSTMASANTTLQTNIDNLTTAAATARTTLQSALQASIDSNKLTSDSAETSLGSRITVLETDPTTKTYVDSQITSLVGGAPDLLNTLDEIAAAINDDDNAFVSLTSADTALGNRITVLEADPTTATAVAAVQADVDQNETDADTAIANVSANLNNEGGARLLADNALDVRITVLEVDPTTATAVAAVQADVDQNESDCDSANALKFDKTGGTVTGNVVVAKSFPDFQLRADDEKRILFTDAGGGGTAAIKHVGSSLDFYAGGIAGGNKEFVIASSGVTVSAAVTLSGGLIDAANDSAADSAGVAVGQLYRNGSVVMIRVS